MAEEFSDQLTWYKLLSPIAIPFAVYNKEAFIWTGRIRYKVLVMIWIVVNEQIDAVHHCGVCHLEVNVQDPCWRELLQHCKDNGTWRGIGEHEFSHLAESSRKLQEKRDSFQKREEGAYPILIYFTAVRRPEHVIHSGYLVWWNFYSGIHAWQSCLEVSRREGLIPKERRRCLSYPRLFHSC